MKVIYTFIAVAITSSIFLSCKDTQSNSPLKTEKSEVTKPLNKAAVKPEIASFNIEGMTCAIGCAKTIESKLSKMDGIQKASVDFENKQATVEFDASVVTPEKLVEAVEGTGDGETYKVSNIKTKGKA